MNQKYNVYLVSDSTGETLDRIFLSLKSQFANFDYEKKEFAFIRTEQQIDKMIKECCNHDNSLILYIFLIIALSRILYFFQDFIISVFPISEFYINFFFESVRNIFEIWKNLITSY